MDKRNAIKIARQYLARLAKNDFAIEKAYIFGSFTKGNYHKDSDIDLAIVLNNFSNSFDMEVKSMTLRRKIETIIEPHLFDQTEFNASNPFAYEILKTGLEINLS